MPARTPATWAAGTVTAIYEIVPAGVKIDLPGVDPLKYQTPAQPANGSEEWLTGEDAVPMAQPDGDVKVRNCRRC
ncbi:MAG: DUF3520 domain-containing protein [Gemmataceae bacterium]